MKRALLCLACLILALVPMAAFSANVLQNPGCEIGTDPVAYPWATGGWGTAGAVTDAALAHTGQRCWRITGPDGTPGSQGVGNFGCGGQLRPCKPGQTFNLSVWVKVPNATPDHKPRVRLRYGFFNAAGAWTAVSLGKDVYPDNGNWFLLSADAPIVAPADAAQVVCRVYVYYAYRDAVATADIADTGANFPAYIDDFSADATDTFFPVSGTVMSGGSPLAGATVNLVEPASQFVWDSAETDAAGNYTLLMSAGTYDIHAKKTGYSPNPARIKTVAVSSGVTGKNFTLNVATPPNRTVPQADQLLFSSITEMLPDPEPGLAMPSGDWPTFSPAGGLLTQISTPQAELINGVKWTKYLRDESDGFRYGSATAYSSPIAVNGASIVMAVKPIRNTVADGWNSCVDIFYNRLVLGVRNNTGRVNVILNGTQTYAGSATAIRDGQTTILSLVVQPNGTYKVWANGTQIMDVTTVGDMTSLVPNVPGPYAGFINVGRNNPDGWTAYNGGIGDVFVYKTALTDAERQQLEADLTTRFHASSTTYTVTASAGVGGSISPTGAQVVAAEADKKFTITPSPGYAVANVLVDGVSVGAVTSYTFNDIVADHTISATFQLLTTYPVTGRVIDQATSAGVAGATIYFSSVANASVTPAFFATTDASGNYTAAIPSGTWYACASQDRFVTSADIAVTVNNAAVANANFSLVSSGRNIPKMDKLLFSNVTDSFPASGATGAWSTFHPKGLSLAVIGTPEVELIGGTKWEKNVYRTGDPSAYVYESDGYRFGGTYTSSIPCNGASVVTVVKPKRDPEGNWDSVVDVFYNKLVLGVMNSTGQVCVWRNGERLDAPAATAIPEGRPTLLSLVVQPDGTYKVWANGTMIMENTGLSNMTALVPGGAGHEKNINVGRNNPDGWTTFNGNIGDVFLYTTALTEAERKQLEADLAAKFLSTVTGRVVDSTGAPVVGATVDLMDTSYIVVGSAVTGADGKYSIIAPGNGDWLLQASKLGYEPYPSYPGVPVTVSVNGPNPASDIVIDLATTTTLDGYVRDETGAVVVGATVDLRLFTGGAVEKTTTTNASGYYSIEVPISYTYYVTAHATKHATSAEAEVVVYDNNPIHQDFVCQDLSKPVISVDAADATTDGWLNRGVYGGSFTAITGAIAASPSGPANDLRNGVIFGGAQWLHLTKDGTWVPAGAEITGSSPHTVIAWVYDPLPASNNSWRDAYISWAPQGLGTAGNGMYLGLGWQVWGSAVCGFDAGTTPTINWPGSDGDFDTSLANSTAPWGRWAQVVTVYTGSAYKIYVDGVERTDMGKSFATNTVPGYQIYLGGAAAGAAPDAGRWGDSAFTGTIARLKMYAYALDQAEITADFQNAPAVVGSATTVANLAALKAKADGTIAQLSGLVSVIYAPRNNGRQTDFFYIGEAQGVSGLKVVDNRAFNVTLSNQLAGVMGKLHKPANAEPWLELYGATITSTNKAIAPVGMNNKSALTDANVLANAVKVWGKVKSVAADGTSFVISDGYGADVTVNVNGIAMPEGFDDTKTAVVTGVVNAGGFQAQTVDAF